MRFRSVWLSILMAALAAPAALAQGRIISGTVTDSVTGRPVIGATISPVGTSISTTTRENGNFVLPNAPAGDIRLQVRAIGYRSSIHRVGAGEAVVSIQIERSPFRLEDVVVSGQATGVLKENLPNAVSVVTSDELERAPAQTLEGALQGKVAGAYIQENSGAPGGGFQLNLRGISTINGSVDPLFVVDGIVISNATIPNGQNAVTAAAAGGNASNQDNPVNRIADLNPDDIEKIEILKGGAAAAIYGARASNGVVIITTKRGQAGAPQFNISQRLGFSARSNSIGSRTFATAAEARTVYDSALVAANFVQGRTFDYEDLLYGRKALSYETSANVRGGTEQTLYYLGGSVADDEGIGLHTGYKKQTFRGNLDQRLSRLFNLSVSTNLIHSTSDRALSNNDNTGTSPGLVLPFTPNFFDPLPDANGVFPSNPFERSNPLQTFSLLTNREEVWRILGTATARMNLMATERQDLTLLATGGVDFFQQRNDFLSPPELQFEPSDGQPGTVILGKAQNTNLNLTVNATHQYRPASRAYEATTSLGMQFVDRQLNSTSIVGRTLLTGQSSPNQAASRDVNQNVQKARDLGIYGQEEVLLMDRRLLLTAGLRADRSSNNGDPDKYFFYPRVAGSYRILSPGGFLNEVKLRGAYGETGNSPLFGMKFRPDTSAVDEGRFGTYVGPRAGDPGVRPERQKEIELGFDAQMFDRRAWMTFTVYQRRITDLLQIPTLAPSIGQTDRVFNGGVLRNRGVEVSLQFVPVQSGNVYWLFGSTFSLNRSKITELPIPSFQTGGFGTALGAFQIEQGKSATQIIGLVNGVEQPVGDAYPSFQMGFSNDVDVGSFHFGMQWDYKQGGDVINLTRLLFDAGSNSPDPDGGAARFGEWAAGNTPVYVESGTYVKLRELSVSYDLPPAMAATMFGAGARQVRLTLSGRNLLRFTPYTGYDPEVSNFGNQAIARNIDVAPFPPSRSFYFTVDVGF